MSRPTQLDCVVIGYNETPFQEYQQLIQSYGENSEAYRDLKFNFVNIDGKALNYVDLLNGAVRDAAARQPSHSFAGAAFESGDIPNLAAVYLCSYLRRRGIRTEFINLFQHERDALAKYLAQDPYCVAITTTFYVINYPVYEMVRFIRAQNPRVKIVLGGPLIANHQRNYDASGFQAALEDLGADIYVTEGQGEATLAQLVECLKSGGDLSTVPNLAHFEHGALVRTGAAPENNSMDENFIDWTMFPDYDLGRTLQTRTARSCAFNCAFCNYPTRAGKLTLASLPTVERELDAMRELSSVQNVVFIDDTFNVPLPRFKDLCRLMIRKNYGFNWFSYFRCSNSDEEAIDLMARSGCKGVFLGIESGSPAILKNMNKAATIEKYAQGISLLRSRDILTFASFILGYPGETADTVEETVQFIKEHRPTYYRAQLWYCEPGTPIDQQRVKYETTGSGFVWRHRTMDSLTAMDHIDRLFLSINESEWLPQWSFDFWIIPYLLGKGLSGSQLGRFMTIANRLLRLEIATLRDERKADLQKQYRKDMLDEAGSWTVNAEPGRLAQPEQPARSFGSEVDEPSQVDAAELVSISLLPAARNAAPSPDAGSIEGQAVDSAQQAVEMHPEVTRCVVVQQDRPGCDPIRVAYYSSRNAIDSVELRRSVLTHLSPALAPHVFVHLPKMPLGLDGNINYDMLPDLSAARNGDRRPTPPRTPAEQTVKDVWEAVLGARQLGVHDNFYELSADRLKAARILVQLRDAFGLTAPLPSMAATPTIYEQALAITEILLSQQDTDDMDELVRQIADLPAEAVADMLTTSSRRDPV